MGQTYTTVTIVNGEGADRHVQEYVTLVGVTAEQIRSGDDTGVICLSLQPGYAAILAGLLNGARKDLAA